MWTFSLRNPGSVSYSRDGELKIGDDVTYYKSESEDYPATGIGSSCSDVGAGP